MTETERILWRYLRKERLGVRFRRQTPIGRYIVDFVALKINLVIEIDGSQHFEPEHMKSDMKRTQYLEGLGFKVIRYTNTDVFESLEEVVENIGQNIREQVLILKLKV